MPYAVTHILAAIILVELFRTYFIKDNKKFPRYYILIAAFGGILPDLDWIAVYVLYPFGIDIWKIHPAYTHILLLPLALFFIGILASKLKIKNKELGKKHLHLKTIFFILAATSLLHISLDLIFHNATALFYPFSKATFGLSLDDLIPLELRNFAFATLDGILLLLWLFYRQHQFLWFENY